MYSNEQDVFFLARDCLQICISYWWLFWWRSMKKHAKILNKNQVSPIKKIFDVDHVRSSTKNKQIFL